MTTADTKDSTQPAGLGAMTGSAVYVSFREMLRRGFRCGTPEPSSDVAKKPKKLGKFRRKKGSRVWGFSSWNWEADHGDYMVRHLDGTLWRLEESRGRNKAAAGELTPRKIPPPVAGAIAEIRGNDVFWVMPNDQTVPTAGALGASE